MTTLNTFTRITHLIILLMLSLLLPLQAQVQWERIADGLTANRTIRGVAVDSTGRIFALNQDGVLYRWNNDSMLWQPQWTNVPIDNPYHIVNNVLAANAAGLFTITSHPTTIQQGPYELKGTDYTPLLTTNGGEKWVGIGDGIMSDICTGSNGMIAISLAHTRLDYIANGIIGGSLLLSTDNGATWNATATDASLPALRAVTISSSGTIFTGGMDQSDATGPGGFFRSTDLGASWQSVDDSSGIEGSGIGPLICLASSSNKTVFAAFGGWGNSTIYRSTDDGNSWQKKLRTDEAHRFIIIDSMTVILEQNRTWGNSYSSLRSTDNGETWSDIPNGIQDFLIAPDGDLYGLGSGHIWHSSNTGATWEKLSEALPTDATSFTVTPSRHIYVGTQSSGVYRTTRSLSVGGTKGAATSTLSLGTITPNPISGSTTIPVHLLHAEQARLAVFDLLGREVTTLYDGWMQDNETTIQYDANGLARGAYLLVLSTETERASKMIIIE